ncbi:MAG: flagellin FliC [Bdellovibrio sp.]|nr:flagellin FliC [Bdellovibrio sp.]
MSLRINTNVSSLGVQRALSQNQKATERTTLNVATGSRVSDPSADVAATAINAQMTTQLASLGAAKQNADSATDISAIAEGSLSEQSNILNRMRELAVQSASDTFTDTERAMMQKEFSQISEESDRIAKTTKYGDKNLLDGSSNKFEFQVGTTAGAESRISTTVNANTTSDELNTDSASVSSKSVARSAITTIDKGLESVNLQRASFAATQSRLESAGNSLGANIENLSKAKSHVADADLAKEISDLRREQVLQHYQVTILQQVNDQPNLALRLIG